MYSYIIGKVTHKTQSELILENNGIGFEIGVSGNTLFDVETGEICKIYTYLSGREDTLCLYGFSREEEKRLFMKLIDISGIGPKMAMQILSGYDLKTLTVAIASGDVKTLCKIKGLGKKTAELIVLNLKDAAAEDVSGVGTAAIAGDEIADAVNALESLGLARTEAVRLASDAAKKVSGVENIIAYCLKGLNG